MHTRLRARWIQGHDLTPPFGRASIGENYIPGWNPDHPRRQLKALFNLSDNEARLALALSRGRTIAQTALDLGIREGSART